MMRESLPVHCYCGDGRTRWETRSDDRFCAFCGRRLIDAEPKNPVIANDPARALACYFRPVADTVASPGATMRLRGTVQFQLIGHGREQAKAHWKPCGVPEIRPVRQNKVTPNGILVLELGIDVPPGRPPGLLGEGILTISLRGELFEHRVKVYSLKGAFQEIWISIGKTSNAPKKPPFLVFYRGAPPQKNYLQFATSADIPVCWEAATCIHPAVKVRPLAKGTASPVARAEVRWEPAAATQSKGHRDSLRAHTLRPRHTSVPPEYPLAKGEGLQFQPAVLALPCIVESRVEDHRVQVTNVDLTELEVGRIEAEAPWISVALEQGVLPVRVPVGGTFAVRIRLGARALSRGPLPREGRIHFQMPGKGQQPFLVRVESIRRLQTLGDPLLIDPGPAHIVIARLDRDRGRAVYPRQVGDFGIAPEDLGLDPEAYSRAIYHGEQIEAMLRRLVRGALPALGVGAVGHPRGPRLRSRLGASGWSFGPARARAGV